MAFGVDRQLPLFNLTHEIPPYDIWAAAYRLLQTAPYCPAVTVWSNIDADKMQQAGFSIGDTLCVTITNAGKEFFNDKARYTNSFGDVAEGETLVYLNSLLNASVAINLGNFAEKYGVSSGAEWDIAMRECR